MGGGGRKYGGKGHFRYRDVIFEGGIVVVLLTSK